MKKFEGILFCTDLDGTLLQSDHTVSKENLNAIEYFKQEGGLFTFVTGRMPYFATDVYRIIQPNAPFGCINGGGIYDPRINEYVWTIEMPREVTELVKYAEQKIPEIGIQVNTFDNVYFCRENSAMARFREITKVPNLVCHYDGVRHPIAKIVFGDENEENINALKRLLDAHPKAGNFDFIRSEQTLYEILPKGISKGAVLRKLTEVLQIDIRKTVAVGDYNNDISMLLAAGLGIAVSNAVEGAKSVADHITVSNDEHAIARVIADLDCGILTV